MLLEYADLLAVVISNAVKEHQDTANHNGIGFFGVQIKNDLHPVDGYLVSTKKTVKCQDNKGNRYHVTVEANPVVSLEEKLKESNLRHSRNGDPISYLIESLSHNFAAQDPTMLAEITDEEIEMLVMEVKAAREASQEKVTHVQF
jgi:hypothetical protein